MIELQLGHGKLSDISTAFRALVVKTTQQMFVVGSTSLHVTLRALFLNFLAH